MIKNLIASTITFASFFIGGSVYAGSFADFENALRDAYGDYRSALFMTNTGKAEGSVKAMASLTTKWTAINKTWGANPPPQYADDPKWHETLQGVSGEINKAAEEITAGKFPEAHRTLEHVRESIGELHHRNNIVTFSDRMNSYHAIMEKVIDSAGLKPLTILEQAAVLKYLAEQAVAQPPADASASSEFAGLAKAMNISVDAVLEAARAGDAAKIKAAIDGLKPAYAKLFVKFG